MPALGFNFYTAQCTVEYRLSTAGSWISVTNSTIVNVEDDAAVYIRATPKSGYQTTGWEVWQVATQMPVDEGTLPYQGGTFQFSMAEEMEVHINTQATPTYTCYLYYNANGGSGAPSTQSYTGTSTSSHQFIVSGTIPTRSGYHFSKWYDSSSPTTYYVGGDTISVPYNGSKTLKAFWVKEVDLGFNYDTSQCTVEYKTGGGSWTVAPTSGAITLIQGASVDVRVTGKTGYNPIGWEIFDLGLGENIEVGYSFPFSFTMDTDTAIQVNVTCHAIPTSRDLMFDFNNTMCTVRYKVGNDAWNDVLQSGAVQVASSSDVTIEAVAKSGYIVDGWLLREYTPDELYVDEGFFDSNNQYVLHMDLDYIFEINTSTASTYTITATAGSGGTITPSGVITVTAGESVTFTITANNGYRIKRILVDGNPIQL